MATVENQRKPAGPSNERSRPVTKEGPYNLHKLSINHSYSIEE